MKKQNTKKIVFILAGIIDVLIGVSALLIYFGILPLGVTTPSVVLAVIGVIFLITGVGALIYSTRLT
jgi:ABC-type multidrug transport system permease subunit